MPCKGLKDNLEDSDDCLAQVHEILQKYGKTHYIIVGGGGGRDFNEDITSQKVTKRQSSLNQLINENRLSTNKTGKTYVSPIGVEASTLDYVLHNEDLASRVRGIKVLDDVQSNVSDHYPVMLAVELGVNRVSDIAKTMPQSSKIKWEKIDKEAYNATVTEKISVLKTDMSSPEMLDQEIRRLNAILVNAAEGLVPWKVKRHRKAKLKVYTPEIK